MAEPSQLEKKVADQIEYYFGDHNLVRDRFLKEQLQLDDGWVTLETMLKFNRLKTLTSEEAVIVAALSKSKTGLLEISEDKTKIRRNPNKPLPEMNDEYKDVLKHKSVYVKGFPLDASLDDVKGWVGDKADIENIQLRKGALKTFKGSIFMVLTSEDAAKQFVARDDVRKFKDNDLIVLMKEDYYAKKAEERKHSRAMEKSKARSEKEEKQKQAEEEEMKSLEEQKGCLLRFTGVGDQTSREDFHEVFAGHADIKWIDFTRGAKEGTILFRSKAAEALEKAKAAKGGPLQVKGKEVQWDVLEGDAEMDTLKKIIEDQQESHNRRRGRGGHRGGGRGGRGRGGRSRDRGGRDRDHHPQGKKTKFDSGDEADHTSPKKRALEANGKGAAEPAAKQVKTENGS